MADLRRLGQAIAAAAGASFGILVDSADAVGAAVVGCAPGANGLGAAAMVAQPRKAVVMLGIEPYLDAHDPMAMRQAMASAELVVALTAFKGAAPKYAHVILPVAPFAETDGAYVNMEGRVQDFRAAVKPQGEARPAWKVLRVLGNLLGLDGFDFASVETVRAAALPEGEASARVRLDNSAPAGELRIPATAEGLERLGETPIYAADSLTRRAPALQATQDSEHAKVCWLRGDTIQKLGLSEGKPVKIVQDGGESIMKLGRDDRLAEGVARIAGAQPLASKLGPRYGAVRLEKM
jgi:NADH-quinone oxidoreductase subunit G